MKKILFVLALLSLSSVSAAAQNSSKPWTEWSKKDAEKILNDSAWGQTQTQEPAQSADARAISNPSAGINRTGESGEGPRAKPLYYRARLLTAKPVREAYARMVLLSSQSPTDELKTQLQGFVDRDFGDFLVVSFVVDSEDERMSRGATMGLTRITLDTVKDKVYLERKDGKHATLVDYKPPISDGLGAKFVFSRSLDGAPFLSNADDALKFVFQMTEKNKVSVKYKVSSMTYNGKLEF